MDGENPAPWFCVYYPNYSEKLRGVPSYRQSHGGENHYLISDAVIPEKVLYYLFFAYHIPSKTIIKSSIHYDENYLSNIKWGHHLRNKIITLEELIEEHMYYLDVDKYPPKHCLGCKYREFYLKQNNKG